MRWVAIVLGALVVLVLAILGGAYVVLRSIDWNEYKAPISEAAFDATGRRLDLAGDLSLSIGFTPGVRIESVGFENASWGSRKQMATLEELVVRLELLPLLFGEVVVDRVDLVGLDVLLEKNAQGAANWEFETVAAAEPSRAPTPTPSPSEPGGVEESRPMATLLRNARIERARVVIRDAAGKEQRVEIERLIATAGEPGGPLKVDLQASYMGSPIELRGDLTGLRDLQAGGPLGLDLALAAGGASGTVAGRIGRPLEARDIDLTVALEGKSLAGFDDLAGSALPALGPYAIAVKLGGGGDRYEVRDLALRVGKSSLTGGLGVDLAGSRPRIQGKLASPLLDAADFSEPSAGRAPASAPKPPASAPQTSGGSSQPDLVFSSEPLPLDGLDAADADITLEAKVVLSGDLRLEDTSLRVRIDARRLRVAPLKLRLAGGDVAATLSLEGARARPPVALAATIRGLVVGDLLRSQGTEILSDGPADVDLDVKGVGSSLHDIMASLNGNLGVRMGPGVLHDEWAGIALSDVTSLVETAATRKGAKIGCLQADFDIRDGVARPTGLVVDLGSVALFGEGKVDLGSERLSLSFDRVSYGTSVGKALPPFKVKGTLAEPAAKLDATAVADHVVDLTAGILGKNKDKDKRAAGPRPATCPELLVAYAQAGGRPASASDVAADAAGLISKKAGKTGKKVSEGLKELKGLFGR